MTFAEAVQSGLKNTFKFVGLAGRREYWFFQLFVFLVNIVATTLDSVIFPLPSDASLDQQILQSPISLISAVGLFLPQLSMLARRLRDVGFSAKWLWLWLPATAYVLLVTFAMAAVDAQGQSNTLEGSLNVLGYLYPAAMVCSGILLFFFIVTLQPSKSGLKGNKYAPDYDPTRDPKSDQFNGGSDDWQPKL